MARILWVAGMAAGIAAAQDAAFFETKVRPLLARSCYGCHGPDQQLSSLRVDSREALLKGGQRGPALVAGDPDQSLLLRAVRHQGLQMPVGGRLKDAEIAALAEWVRSGAVWPAGPAPSRGSTADRYRKLAAEHWAFQPVRAQAPPEGPAAHPVDRFVLASLRRAGLPPAPAAEKRILIRRLSYGLTGLPPSAEEADAFVNDASPRAYEALVDRLLASPRFGEHWARHWLDLVRYGETRGYEWNYEIIGAWRYRDYLIRAFNADVPYDQLVREHIAGDLLEQPRIDTTAHSNESLIGTAFYRLGEAGHDDCIQFREIALDVVDNQIDTLTKTFQGLTVSCARCHDHKLDPIPTEDYYGLYSILNSSRAVTHTIDTAESNRTPIERLRHLKAKLQSELASLWNTAPISLYPLPPEKEAPLEDPGSVWQQLRDAADFPTAAKALEARYRQEDARRREAFTRNYEPLGAWHLSGMGLRDGAAPPGSFALAPEGNTVVSGIYPAGWYSHLLSQRLNAAMRSPYLPKNRKFVSVRVLGGMLGARRTVIDNCAIGEQYKVLDSDQPAWIRLDTHAAQERLPVFLELVTRSDNPRLPDRPGVLKDPQLKLINEPRSYVGLVDAVLHDTEESPQEDLSPLLALFAGGAPRSLSELEARYHAVLREAVTRWASGRATNATARWLDWAIRKGLLPNHAAAATPLAALIAEYRRTEQQLTPARVVEGLADIGPGRDGRVLLGGNPKSDGPPAPRRFLRMLYGDAPLTTTGSGRRELADRLASPSNPLTARVMVNRVWHHLFGRGLVPSADNFGLLGDTPSHPELLDYLAARFAADGWSIKKLIRLLVTSSTFRQSGQTTPLAREKDPRNALLHHYPLRRLSGEALRDSILVASGKLQAPLFGPSIDPFRDEAKDYRRLFAGPLDGAGRRSLYLKVTRMDGYRFLETFDYPNPMATRGTRDVTNVPLQALTLLNDPFVIAEAEACARRLLATPASGTGERIDQLFRIILSRRPTAVERERLSGLIAELASLQRVPAAEVPTHTGLWKDAAHAMFNWKEFLYVP